MQLDPWIAYIHGACLVLLDGIGVGLGNFSKNLRSECFDKLLERLPDTIRTAAVQQELSTMSLSNLSDRFGIAPFFITKGNLASKELPYALNAPTTSKNLQRLLRSMQLRKAILLVCYSFFHTNLRRKEAQELEKLV
jgi:midasin